MLPVNSADRAQVNRECVRTLLKEKQPELANQLWKAPGAGSARPAMVPIPTCLNFPVTANGNIGQLADVSPADTAAR